MSSHEQPNSHVTRAPYVTTPVWVLHHPDLSAIAVRVFGCIANYGGVAFPTRRRLASEAHCALATLDKALAELVAAGALQVTKRLTDNGDRTSSLYTLGYLESRQPPPESRQQVDQELDNPLPSFCGSNYTHVELEPIEQEQSAQQTVQRPAKSTAGRATKAPPMSAGERNAYTDALIAFVGRVPEQADQVGWKKFRDFTNWAVGAGITAGQIGERAARYILDWPDMERTPDALKRHWSRFAVDAPVPAPQRRGRGLSVAELANWEG